MSDQCKAVNKKKESPKSKKSAQSANHLSKKSSHAKNDKPLIEFPHMLRIIGPKHIKILMQFAPSAVFYSLTSLVLVTYMSEWKTVLQYLPYYNGKYYKDTAEIKKKDDANDQ